jgi:hypothetical protein
MRSGLRRSMLSGRAVLRSLGGVVKGTEGMDLKRDF